jgi:hypothetical protein
MDLIEEFDRNNFHKIERKGPHEVDQDIIISMVDSESYSGSIESFQIYSTEKLISLEYRQIETSKKKDKFDLDKEWLEFCKQSDYAQNTFNYPYSINHPVPTRNLLELSTYEGYKDPYKACLDVFEDDLRLSSLIDMYMNGNVLENAQNTWKLNSPEYIEYYLITRPIVNLLKISVIDVHLEDKKSTGQQHNFISLVDFHPIQYPRIDPEITSKKSQGLERNTEFKSVVQSYNAYVAPIVDLFILCLDDPESKIFINNTISESDSSDIELDTSNQVPPYDENIAQLDNEITVNQNVFTENKVQTNISPQKANENATEDQKSGQKYRNNPNKFIKSWSHDDTCLISMHTYTNKSNIIYISDEEVLDANSSILKSNLLEKSDEIEVSQAIIDLNPAKTFEEILKTIKDSQPNENLEESLFEIKMNSSCSLDQSNLGGLDAKKHLQDNTEPDPETIKQLGTFSNDYINYRMESRALHPYPFVIPEYSLDAEDSVFEILDLEVPLSTSYGANSSLGSSKSNYQDKRNNYKANCIIH